MTARTSRDGRPSNQRPGQWAWLVPLLALLLAACETSDGAGGRDQGITDGVASLEDAGPPTAPAAPQKLQAVGLLPTVALSWQAGQGGTPVAGYRVYRGEVQIADTAESSLVDDFADTTAPTRCTPHDYHVVAYDAEGNLSQPSAKVPSTLAMKNLVLLIGDGMGPEQQRAAGCYRFGPAYGSSGNQLAFETLPVQGKLQTASADSAITDSAAASTALATGTHVNNGVISIAQPGDGSELYTLLECFKDLGRRTGLVTTTEMSHATPAGFGAHAKTRYDLPGIVQDYLGQTRPNVLFGGRNALGINAKMAQTAGYTVVSTRAEMQQLQPGTSHSSGQFYPTHMPYEADAALAKPNPYDTLPHLSEMATAAIGLLQSPAGFFLLVEGGRIDHACHKNLLAQAVLETVEFEKTTKAVLDWASGRADTLVIVTADHETGGLKVQSCGAANALPSVSWSSGDHTATDVNLYASGVSAQRLAGTHPNTALFRAIVSGAP